MNSFIEKITTLGKSFYGLIIYFSITYIFNFVLKALPINNKFQYNILLSVCEITTLLLLIIVFRKRLKKDFIDFDKNYKKYLKLGFTVWFFGLIVMTVSNNIIYHFITTSGPANQGAAVNIINNYPLYSVFSMILIGPFIEEIVFRLSFKNALKNKKVYYILSVLIFTSLHALNGMNTSLALIYFLPYGSLAFALSYILDKTDNIFTTVIIHSIHNAISFVLIAMTSML